MGNKLLIRVRVHKTSHKQILLDSLPAPRGNSRIVVVQYPLNAHHIALGLLQQHRVIDVVNTKLGLVVVGLVFKEISLKVITLVLVLFVKE